MRIEPVAVQVTVIMGYHDENGRCVKTTQEPTATLHWPQPVQLLLWLDARVQERRQEAGLPYLNWLAGARAELLEALASAPVDEAAVKTASRNGQRAKKVVVPPVTAHEEG